MMTKKIVLGTAIAAILSSGVASAGLTGNIGVGSNYIWRGITQTSDQAAVSGGLDWSQDSGLYAGTWISNVDFDGTATSGYEQDLYVGFGGEAGGLGYDVSIATFMYPVTPEFNFTELGASLTYSVVTVSLGYTVDAASGNDAENTVGASGLFDEGDLYVGGSLDFPTGAGDVSVYAGTYMFDNSDKSYANGNSYGDLDYVHYGVSLSKDDFTIALDKNDLDETANGKTANNVRVTVSWAKEFELM